MATDGRVEASGRRAGGTGSRPPGRSRVACAPHRAARGHEIGAGQGWSLTTPAASTLAGERRPLAAGSHAAASRCTAHSVSRAGAPLRQCAYTAPPHRTRRFACEGRHSRRHQARIRGRTEFTSVRAELRGLVIPCVCVCVARWTTEGQEHGVCRERQGVPRHGTAAAVGWRSHNVMPQPHALPGARTRQQLTYMHRRGWLVRRRINSKLLVRMFISQP